MKLGLCALLAGTFWFYTLQVWSVVTITGLFFQLYPFGKLIATCFCHVCHFLAVFQQHLYAKLGHCALLSAMFWLYIFQFWLLVTITGLFSQLGPFGELIATCFLNVGHGIIVFWQHLYVLQEYCALLSAMFWLYIFQFWLLVTITGLFSQLDPFGELIATCFLNAGHGIVVSQQQSCYIFNSIILKYSIFLLGSSVPFDTFILLIIIESFATAYYQCAIMCLVVPLDTNQILTLGLILACCNYQKPMLFTNASLMLLP